MVFNNFQMQVPRWILLWFIIQEASDLHVNANGQYYIRINHLLNIINLSNNKIISKVQELLHEERSSLLVPVNLLTKTQQEQLKEEGALDYAFSYEARRFRVNIYRSNQGYNLAMRLIRKQVIPLSTYPKVQYMEKIIAKLQGLVLICGKTGSGKSTTMASFLECLNQRECLHMITLEDPIEYLFQDGLSFINQREYKRDFYSFDDAIRMSLREDADVIMVGEIRDAATMKATLDAAESGHLVFATLHARTIEEVILRIQAFFPLDASSGIREQIASSLNAVILQQMKHLSTGESQVDMDIILSTYAIQNLIRKGKEEQINSYASMNIR